MSNFSKQIPKAQATALPSASKTINGVELHMGESMPVWGNVAPPYSPDSYWDICPYFWPRGKGKCFCTGHNGEGWAINVPLAKSKL
ncbi:hypothetical protein K435DRAFT_873238 [Dendrothele bispora CBS 962.96]|uniref:Uncharacterized protein n=1 Tax=Dendrothele bispora (strain CBS 962.96) TaxID=1314807 RepID=A0A4S8KZN3_DENBC|nr:hypothetical protein K435DRAFT_873238 [Dendrothele bispora CBS 962.96]